MKPTYIDDIALSALFGRIPPSITSSHFYLYIVNRGEALPQSEVSRPKKSYIVMLLIGIHF